MNISIYCLIDPRTKEIRYVGKTINPERRLRKHLIDTERNHRVNWIRSVLNDGIRPVLEVLERCSEDAWREAERFWISYLRFLGARLTNSIDGGNGGNPSPETREKLRLAKLGKKASASARANMSKAFRGNPKKPFTAERKQQHSEKLKGVPKPIRTKSHATKQAESNRATWATKRAVGLAPSFEQQRIKKYARNMRYYFRRKLRQMEASVA